MLDSIVEEHECTDNVCIMIIENSYSGIDPMSGHPAVLNERMVHPNRGRH